MGKHAHQLHDGTDLIAAAKVALEDAGEQWTTLRAQVFGILAVQSTPASAYDIADQLARANGRRVAANSIYRILDIFVAKNLAKRIESANAYIANAHPGCHHDCIFLVCDQCRTASHMDDDILSAAVRTTATGAGFQNIRPVIEVRGICAKCAAEQARAS
jgi:Fur family transcriptional regulator, zinc uptake regulator